MFDSSKIIKKMLGPGINVYSYRQGKSMRDSDGDGINDIMDCQPKNMFRQDMNIYKVKKGSHYLPTFGEIVFKEIEVVDFDKDKVTLKVTSKNGEINLQKRSWENFNIDLENELIILDRRS